MHDISIGMMVDFLIFLMSLKEESIHSTHTLQDVFLGTVTLQLNFTTHHTPGPDKQNEPLAELKLVRLEPLGQID